MSLERTAEFENRDREDATVVTFETYRGRFRRKARGCEAVMSDRQTSLDALNQAHAFPVPFMFKVIGENSPAFIAQVVQAAVNVLGPRVTPEVTTRESSGGRHQAVSMVVEVPSAEQVLAVYDVLRGLAGVKMLL